MRVTVGYNGAFYLTEKRRRASGVRRRREKFPITAFANVSVLVEENLLLSERGFATGGPLITGRYRR